LAYGYGKGLKQTIVVYDFGGGTFDISVLELRDNVFEVKATGGNTFLGGVDFDNKLAGHVIAEFKQAHNIDLARDPMSHQRVTDACEKAKIDLSTMNEARINIPYIAQGPEGPLNLDMTIKRDQFEEMIGPLVDKAMEITAKVVRESKLGKDQIEQVLLVGGSTRIPLVAKKVAEFFGKPPSKGVHPDEAVALGAAIMADALVNRESDIQLLDVLPINLAIALPNGRTMPIFDRNTSVPNQKMKVFTTSKDNQDSLKVQLVQGDSEKVDECEPIGEFVFRGIHPAAKGKARVEMVFTINSEGLLSLSARDPDTGVEQSGVLTVSDTVQKTYHQDLIQPKKPVEKKEAQKVITRTVTQEKKLKAAEAPTPKPVPSSPSAPNASARKGTPAPAQKAAAPPPRPAKPAKPARPAGKGLFARIRGWFQKKKT
ncbi:MAG TPA: Hsp70 family protein, partial [bacterium]|nr:Hsp70 family protein [bacterium]